MGWEARLELLAAALMHVAVLHGGPSGSFGVLSWLGPNTASAAELVQRWHEHHKVAWGRGSTGGGGGSSLGAQSS